MIIFGIINEVFGLETVWRSQYDVQNCLVLVHNTYIQKRKETRQITQICDSGTEDLTLKCKKIFLHYCEESINIQLLFEAKHFTSNLNKDFHFCQNKVESEIPNLVSSSPAPLSENSYVFFLTKLTFLRYVVHQVTLGFRQCYTNDVFLHKVTLNHIEDINKTRYLHHNLS